MANATIKHAFVSAVADEGDTSLVQPSNWNADHTVAAGGSDTEIQFNDSGAVNGDAGLTFNKTTKALNLGGATVTADDPVLDLTQTWNNAAVTFNGIKLNVTNTASAAAAKLMDLQVDGTSQLSVSKTGLVNVASGVGITSSNWTCITGSNRVDGSYGLAVRQDSVAFANGIEIGWSTSHIPNANQTGGATLTADGSGILGLRSGTTSQTVRVYNTYTNTTNYERGKTEWASNIFNVGTEKAGTGTARAMALQTDGTTRATVGAAGGIAMAAANTFTTGAYTVSTLPTAGTVGRIAHVTDGDASLAWGATVVNSGSGATPYLCFDNGTNWTVAGK